MRKFNLISKDMTNEQENHKKNNTHEFHRCLRMLFIAAKYKKLSYFFAVACRKNSVMCAHRDFFYSKFLAHLFTILLLSFTLQVSCCCFSFLFHIHSWWINQMVSAINVRACMCACECVTQTATDM